MALPTNPAPPVTQKHAPARLFICPPEKDSSFSTITNHSSRYARHHGIIRNIRGDDSAGSDNGVRANTQTWQYGRIHADISTESDDHWPDRQIRADDRFTER